MRILFDQGTPAPLRRLLEPHEVSTAYELGWSTLTNGELLSVAQARRFDVLITTDTHLKHQQNLKARSIAIVVLDTTSWPRIRPIGDAIVAAVEAAVAGSYTELHVP